METEFVRNCPCCGDKMDYQTKGGLDNANKRNSLCKSCMVILRNPNVIDKLTEENKYDFSAGEIIRYIYTFPKEERNYVAVKILKLCNPQIDYNIIGKLSSRKQNIEYSCSIHNDCVTATSFRHVIERHQGCRQCKGQKPQGYWQRPDVLVNSMKKLVISVYNKTSCTFNLTNYFEWDSALTQAWFGGVKNPSKEFYGLISDLGLPSPKTNCYLKDGNIFRGFFEFVGYCFISKWGVSFEYAPTVFGKYISDGYFTDLNVHWEHWGELNKNNKNKKKLYDESSFGLFETFDSECRNKGIKYLYNTLKNFLQSNGYNIPEMTHSEMLDVIKGNMSDFDNMMDDIINTVKKHGWDNKIVEHELRPIKEGNVILSFIGKFFNGSITDFKEYLNNNHGFKYHLKAKRGSYKDINHFIKIITPIVKELGYVPTQKYFADISKNDIPVMASRFCGGLNNLRRNEVEEGKYFFIIKDILGDNAPYDRDLVWKDGEFHNNTVKILQFYKDKGVPFPKVLNHLRNNKEYLPFGPALHTQISQKQCNGWNGFVKQYLY